MEEEIPTTTESEDEISQPDEGSEEESPESVQEADSGPLPPPAVPETTPTLKLSVLASPRGILVGVQRQDGKHDPFFHNMTVYDMTVSGDIGAAVEEALLMADNHWIGDPQNPKHVPPPSSEKKEPTKRGRASKPAPAPAPEPEPEPKPQLTLF